MSHRALRPREPPGLLAWLDGPFWEDFDQHIFAKMTAVPRALRALYDLEGDEALSAWLGLCAVTRARRRRRRMLALAM